MHNWLPLNLKLQRLRNKLVQNPYYRFQFGEELELAAKLRIQIDVNQADVDDWLRLPGLSIHQARSLVELSRSGVKFYCIDDIAAALTLPVQRLEPLNPLLNFSYYDHSALDRPESLVNPNTATIATLVKIPLIDQSLAETVVQNRLTFGNYQNLVDFQQRLELSATAIAQLMYYLRF
jgi:DNA uptake protein ComE-like DNA-binding protein